MQLTFQQMQQSRSTDRTNTNGGQANTPGSQSSSFDGKKQQIGVLVVSILIGMLHG
jgi:hypothetical protein